MSAVVGSVDARGTKFVASSNIQEARVEEIAGLASSVEVFHSTRSMDLTCLICCIAPT